MRFVRRNWTMLLLVAVGAGGLGGAALLLVPNIVVRSFAAGFLTATIIGALAHLVSQMTGSGSRAMGELAEQWTASELIRLRRDGWRVVNHVMLQTWDIDHVLVGPGGIYAIETKWSSQPWELVPPEGRVSKAAEDTSRNARNLSHWWPMKKVGAGPASAVVVLWGQSTGAPAEQHLTVGAAQVVPATAVDRWRAALPREGLSQEQVEACWQALEAHVRQRDQRDGPIPETGAALLTRYFAVVASALLGFLALANLVTAVNSYIWWPSAVLIATVFGVGVRRLPVVRPYATGWLVGVVAAIVSIAVLVLHRLG